MKNFLFLKNPKIFKRIKESTPEMEQEFRERFEQVDVPFSDKLVMIGTAFVMIVIPCILVLLGISLLSMWVFGLF